MHAPSWGPAIRKELRALVPAWLAVLAALVAVALGMTVLRGAAVLSYILGAATLGALSIGHEYGNGTLAALLAQPRSRRDLLLTKLLALVPLQLLFAIASHVVLIDRHGPLSGVPSWLLGAFALPMLYGLFVAPWLTMLCRSTIAGTVFTLVVPGLWWIAGTLIASWAGAKPPETGGVIALYGGTLATCGAGAVLGWRTFMRLEAIDGRSADVRLPAWLTRAEVVDDESTTPRRHPVRLLVSKELHLQQLPLAMAVLYVVGWLGVMLFARREPFYVLSFFYAGLVSLVIGSLAAAEERQLGTADSQTLLPCATWKQWTVKVIVAGALTLALAVALPALLARFSPPTDVSPTLATAVEASLGLMMIGLYVSSLSRSGLWALLISLPVTIAVALVVGSLTNPAGWNTLQGVTSGWTRLLGSSLSYQLSARQLDAFRTVGNWLPVVLVGGLVAIALRFGLRNHRSAERGAGRAWRQAIAMATYVVVASVVLGGYSTFLNAGIRNRFSAWDRERITAAMLRRARWQHELEDLTHGFDGRVGVCAGDGISETCVNGEQRFPMQSVWKLPLAIGALDAVDRGAWRLDDKVLVTKKDLSVYVQPMAKLVGPNGYETTIDDLMRRAIVDSDNAAADILLAKLGGPTALQIALRRHFVVNVSIDRDEKHLQSDINGLEWRDEYLDPGVFDRAVAAVPEAKRDDAFQAYLKDQRDTATPRAMTELLERITSFGSFAPLVLSPSSTEHLFDLLKETKTFPDRLKAGIPKGWIIGHKTGTSGDWRGVTAATNDVGILVGNKDDKVAVISIAVFIAESRAPEKDRAALMAGVASALIKTY